MRKVSIIMAIAMALTVMTASVALAEGPSCVDANPTGTNVLDNHGDHITGDYVGDGDGSGIGPGVRGRAAHFGGGASPGATFCNQHGTATPGDVPALPPPLTS